MHGYDFVFIGKREHLERIARHTAGEFKAKVAVAGPQDAGAMRVQKRSIRWASDGFVYECDHRHADRLAEELELTKSQVVVTPSIRESRKAWNTQGENLQNDDGGEGARPHAGAGHRGAGRGVAASEGER